MLSLLEDKSISDVMPNIQNFIVALVAEINM